MADFTCSVLHLRFTFSYPWIRTSLTIVSFIIPSIIPSTWFTFGSLLAFVSTLLPAACSSDLPPSDCPHGARVSFPHGAFTFFPLLSSLVGPLCPPPTHQPFWNAHSLTNGPGYFVPLWFCSWLPSLLGAFQSDPMENSCPSFNIDLKWKVP